MSDGLSILDDEQGWQIGATLQRFKAFQFINEKDSKTFLVRLVSVKTPREVHMQVTPNHMECSVEVLLNYEPINENEVRKALNEIENIFQEICQELDG